MTTHHKLNTVQIFENITVSFASPRLGGYVSGNQGEYELSAVNVVPSYLIINCQSMRLHVAPTMKLKPDIRIIQLKSTIIFDTNDRPYMNSPIYILGSEALIEFQVTNGERISGG